jgi:murein DD-endopeptidase MepM/ murein hydrolase activator NlpD
MKKITIILILVFVLLGATRSNFNIYGQAGESADTINAEIQDLNSGISDKKTQIKKIQDQQKAYEQAIVKKQSEKASLNNQLAILDNRLAKSQLDIELVKTEIDRTNLEIQKTDIEINAKNAEINQEKDHIANVLDLIYQRDNVGVLEILLLNNSLADFLSQVKYLEDINTNIKTSLDDLTKLKRQLENGKAKLGEQNNNLAKLKNDLELKKKNLEAEKGNKSYILIQVSSSEKQYQRLLAQAKKEQQDAAAEISSMEKIVRAKLAKLQGGELKFNDAGLIWPVPNNGVSAYFHDPEYPFRYIFEHPAIDIRSPQGSPIQAAASGYVAVAKNAGMGYSYIMLIHGDGLATVYGHVSKILVKEDDYIVQGQTIGRTGGLPGTPGAGKLTTGPHLHVEVRLNGIPVDPLSYLP